MPLSIFQLSTNPAGCQHKSRITIQRFEQASGDHPKSTALVQRCSRIRRVFLPVKHLPGGGRERDVRAWGPNIGSSRHLLFFGQVATATVPVPISSIGRNTLLQTDDIVVCRRSIQMLPADYSRNLPKVPVPGTSIRRNGSSILVNIRLARSGMVTETF